MFCLSVNITSINSLLLTGVCLMLGCSLMCLLFHVTAYYGSFYSDLYHARLLCVFNKFTQSNLGRGPRRGTVAHVRRKVPIGYNGAPQIRLQKYPFLWTNPQTPLPASSLPHQTSSGSDPPFSTTHARTHKLTDRPLESFLITIGRCAARATFFALNPLHVSSYRKDIV